MPVTIDDIRRAAIVIAGQVVRTPSLHSRTLSEICGCQIVIKFENQQFTASFKDRGALVKLNALPEAEKRAGVIAMSAGNHAQAVAYHARRLGIAATIVMPNGTPHVKVENTQRFGARVLVGGETIDEAAVFARELAAKDGLSFVHPYDDEHVIAGQGTIALEMLEDDPDLDVLVIPIGGGGLIAGNSIAAKAIKPAIEIIGVEAALYPSMYQAVHSLPARAGGRTVAEGIAVKTPGKKTFPVVRELVSEVLVVGEADFERGVQLLLNIEKTVAEGAGAAALAAVLANPEKFQGKRVGCILTGGNIDPRILASIIMRGLVREGRLVRMRIEIPDQPGVLAAITKIIGESGANIMEVYHQRTFSALPVKSADLDIVMETRDMAHVRELSAKLTAAGFKATLTSTTPGDIG
ncbi:MAG: threonine ammonia-lyase [Alphaproteobacteria bacterium]|nr:threonine ammonia-lyase [Alphaproteobacteria bacterium]